MNEDRRRAANQTLGSRWPIWTLYGRWIVGAGTVALAALLVYAYAPRAQVPAVEVAVEAPASAGPGVAPVLVGLAALALAGLLYRVFRSEARMRRRIRRGSR